MQFETILPFLRPIEHLILDPGISEIMVNAGSRIFIERNGELEAVQLMESYFLSKLCMRQ